ncbi:MAG: YgcG family protein [Betaproteobacteria bacterium]|nr:YgcG family protein [Betaproteobacteria bacterium]
MFVFLALAIFALASAARAEVAVPPLTKRVTDLTGTLDASQQANLENRLAALESRKGSQVAVLLVPTVQPEAIEQYAIRVFDRWKLGRKGVDDGVLLLIAKNDRKLRIEVGYGLEGAIPDAIAKRVVEEDIVPRFKQGDFYGGVLSGVDRIAKLVEGETMPAPRPVERSSPSRGWSNADLLFYGFIAVMIFGGLLRSLFGRMLGAGATALAAGAIAYFLFSVGIAVIVAIVAFLLTLGGRIGYGGSGWSSGGSWSSGGGGFSGGGGSAGGGGASGGW